MKLEQYEHHRTVQEEKKMKVRIEGMSCSGCSSRVEKALKALPGIKDVSVDLADHSASYSGQVSDAQVQEAIEDIGYEVRGFEQ